jgi:hypothetical protein
MAMAAASASPPATCLLCGAPTEDAVTRDGRMVVRCTARCMPSDYDPTNCPRCDAPVHPARLLGACWCPRKCGAIYCTPECKRADAALHDKQCAARDAERTAIAELRCTQCRTQYAQYWCSGMCRAMYCSLTCQRGHTRFHFDECVNHIQSGVLSVHPIEATFDRPRLLLCPDLSFDYAAIALSRVAHLLPHYAVLWATRETHEPGTHEKDTMLQDVVRRSVPDDRRAIPCHMVAVHARAGTVDGVVLIPWVVYQYKVSGKYVCTSLPPDVRGVQQFDGACFVSRVHDAGLLQLLQDSPEGQHVPGSFRNVYVSTSANPAPMLGHARCIRVRPQQDTGWRWIQCDFCNAWIPVNETHVRYDDFEVWCERCPLPPSDDQYDPKPDDRRTPK